MRQYCKSALKAVILAIALDATVASVHGASQYWDTNNASGLQAGTGTWSLASSDQYWTADAAGVGNPAKWNDGNDAVFSASGTSAITVDGSGNKPTANSLTFSGTGYTLSSGVVTLSGAASITTSQNATINSTIAGSAGMIKAGGSTLTLGGNNYTGTTAINAGTLSLSSGSSLTSATVNIGSSGTLSGTGTASSSTVNVTGKIAPGDSAPYGLLRTGSETWNTGGALAVRLDSANGANHDTLRMSGLTVAATTFNIQLTGSGSLPTLGRSWIIAAVNGGNSSTFDSSVLSKFVLSVTGMGAATASNFTFSEATDTGFGGGEDLIVTYSTNAAPEPTSLIMLGGPLIPLALARRRRNSGEGQA